MKRFILITLALLPGIVGCSSEHGHGPDGEHVATDAAGDDDHGDEHAPGPNGGIMLELGGQGHLEYVDNHDTETMHLYVFAKDGKTPLPIERAPEIKITSGETPSVIATVAVNPVDGKSAEYKTADGALTDVELHGRITIHIGDKVYNPTVEEHEH